MSEQASEAVKETAPAPSLDEIRTASAEAVKSAIAELAKNQAPAPEPVDIQSVLADERRRIADAISGKTPEKSVDQVTRDLLTNTRGVLGDVIRQAKEQAVQEIVALYDGEKADRLEYEAAAVKVLGERTDVHKDKSSIKVIQALMDADGSDKPIAERMKAALDEFDLMLEKKGAGTAADRIKAASSISSASAPNSGPQGTSPLDEVAILKDELAFVQANEKAKRNW